MADENKCTEEKKHGCVIECECLRKFLIVALGTFVGVYLALSLFALVHRPQMPCACSKPPIPINQIVIPPHHQAVMNPFHNPHKNFKHHENRNHQKHI